MNAPTPSTSVDQPVRPEFAAATKAVTGWVQTLARTLKTCRLYDPSNPAVLRFRSQLYDSLRELLDVHGAMSLRFNSDDVQMDGASLYPARSRDDNLALAFFRDGIRGLTLSPGIARRELDVLIDGLLLVTGPTQAEDDLVTLLWQADLSHVAVEHITVDGDVVDASASESGQLVPWPAPGEEPAAEGATQPEAGEAGTEEAGGRSDDWKIGETTADFEESWRQLQRDAESEQQRFLGEYATEHVAQPVPMAISISTAYASADATPEDLEELARFLPRVLRVAMTQGDWRSATDAITLLDRCNSPEWSAVSFAQELNQPISVAGIVQWLDQQDDARLDDFSGLTRLLDVPGADLLHLVFVELQDAGHRAKLASAIVESCREQPEHLAAWLADPRAHVVQGVVQMLAQIGGPSIVGLLRAVAEHEDPRVRLEIVNALRQASADDARPVLLRMLEGADPRTFCAALQSLSDRRDPMLATRLLAYLLEPDFDRRSEEERRSIYLALAAVGGDEVVPQIEADMLRVTWFNRGPDPHRQSLGRCLARIGTPLAREVLERGARSRKPIVRKACEDALESLNRNG